MGLWTAIKAGAGALFGSVSASSKGADNVMEVARGVGGWIDEQQFTDEEKAVQLAKLGESVVAFVDSTKDESTQRSITRRSIAIWIMRAEIFTLMASAVIFPISSYWSEYLFKMASYDSPLGWMAVGVAVFFFGSHMLRAHHTGGK